jgi:NAD(P)H-dependent FMN reductase
MAPERSLFLPVLLGTTRQGRMSEHAARFMLQQASQRPSVESVLIDVRELNLPFSDAGERLKHPGFSETMQRADGLIIVTPEYNHGYPGVLKHVLDTNLKEYIHKAVGICGVSAGGFGGTRVIQNLLPVLRELGLVTIFWDMNFSNAAKTFDASGALVDSSYVARADKFLNELIWMSTVLRYGRQQVALG